MAKDKNKMKRKGFDKELQKLQAKLCILQDWVKAKGLRVIIIFEGRDAAGKGGTIKAITERVSPRVFRLVALPAPSDREKSQMYLQRYLLSKIPYKKVPRGNVTLPKRQKQGNYRVPDYPFKIVSEKY